MTIKCTKTSLVNGYHIDLSGTTIWIDPHLEDSDPIISDSLYLSAKRPDNLCCYTSKTIPFETVDVLVTTGLEHTHFPSFKLLLDKLGPDVPVVTPQSHVKRFKQLGFTSVYPVTKSVKKQFVGNLTIAGQLCYGTASYAVTNNTTGKVFIIIDY